MKVCVFGLWHLGCVTAACLADAGHQVVGIDPDSAAIEGLRAGKAPLFEPGLDALIAKGAAKGRLAFTTDLSAASDAEVAWITFDTPVDEDDQPRPQVVLDLICELCSHLPRGALVLISSQLPAGSSRSLSRLQAGRGLTFGYSPENLRLGKAIEVFTRPDRVVVGLEAESDRAKVAALLAPITDRIVWMGLESAEMTKHAINAFLATSIAFMNEIATVCEQVGADAREVELGLKSEARIGPSAYLSPGGAFAGGTLARDIATLSDLGRAGGVETRLVRSVRDSNAAHRRWPFNKLKERFANLAGKRIALLGLTYKPGTDTLRRSTAVELGQELAGEGAKVHAFDPAVRALPGDIAGAITLHPSAEAALAGAVALVLATPWPEFRKLDWPSLLARMSDKVIVDAAGFLAAELATSPGAAYVAVGRPWPRS